MEFVRPVFESLFEDTTVTTNFLKVTFVAHPVLKFIHFCYFQYQKIEEFQSQSNP